MSFCITITLYFQEDSTLPEPEILCARILESHEVYENDGQYLKLAGVQSSELQFTGIVTIQRKPTELHRQEDTTIRAIPHYNRMTMYPTGSSAYNVEKVSLQLYVEM